MQELDNSGHSSIRECVQWIYSAITNLFAYVDYKKNMKLLKSPSVNLFFISCMILHNCYCIMNSNITGKYFEMKTAFTLEEYVELE